MLPRSNEYDTISNSRDLSSVYLLLLSFRVQTKHFKLFFPGFLVGPLGHSLHFKKHFFNGFLVCDIGR